MNISAKFEKARPLTAKDVAARWGCSVRLVYKLIEDGKLIAFYPGSLIRIRPEEVERYECQMNSPDYVRDVASGVELAFKKGLAA